MDRWSLYTGKLYRENARGLTRTGGRYIQVVAKAGLTVHNSMDLQTNAQKSSQAAQNTSFSIFFFLLSAHQPLATVNYSKFKQAEFS
jgi:hypothetical protein